MNALSELGKDYPDEGFGKFYYRMRNKGHSFNHKGVHQVYTGGQKAKPCWLRLDRVGCMVFMFLKQDNTLSRNII
jgi:hypothetical protein